MRNLFVKKHYGGQLRDTVNAEGHVFERNFTVDAVDFAVVGEALPTPISVYVLTVIQCLALKNFH